MALRICPIAFVLASGFLGLPIYLPPAIAETTTPPTQTSESKPIALSLQQAIARELKGGETHNYVVNLKTGQYFQAIAEQKEIDLVILLYSPSGKLIAKSDSPNGRLGLEVMSVIADSDGSYRLEINAPDSKATAGKYTLKVEELRTSTEKDRSYIVGERAFMEAVQLNDPTQQTEARKRQTLAKYLEVIPIFREQEKPYWEMLAISSAGGVFAELGQSAKAIDFYQQSLAIAKKIGDRNGEAAALNNLGLAYDSLGQYQKAIDSYQLSLTIAKQISDLKGEGSILNNLASIYSSLGKYEKATDYLQQALVIIKQIGDLKGEGVILNNLATIYNSLGQYPKATDYIQQALVINKQIGNLNGEATALANLGTTYTYLGQYPKAIDYFQQALIIFKKIGNRSGEGTTLNNLGLTYYNLGQYPKAIDFCQQSLAIQRQIGDRNGEATSLNNLGAAYKSLGQYEKAINFYQQSLAIQLQIGDRNGEVRSLNNLGDTYRNLGQYQKAIDFFQQSLAIFKQIGDLKGKATSLNNLGIAYNNLAQYQKAIDFFQQSSAIQKEIGDRNGEARSLNNLGTAYNSLEKYQKAIDFYQQSLAISKQIGDRNTEGLSLNNLGAAYNSLGKYQKAIDFYQQSLAISKQIGDRDGEGISLSNLGFSFSKLNQAEFAILFYKQSVNIRESIRKDIRGLSKEEQRSYLSTVAESYRALADRLLKQARVTEALQVLDLLKIQELEDYLKNVKGNDRTAQGIQLLEPEKAIGGQLSAISYEKIPELNSQLKNQIQQLPKSEINKVPDYLQKLPQGAVLIYPLILDDRLEIIIFSANALPINRTVSIKKAELEKLVANYRSDLQDYTSIDVKTSSKKLYDILIKPIEADLKNAKATTILYAPDGILRYIPLAALYDGKQWLVEQYRISNLITYSLTDFTPKAKTQPSVLAGAFGGKAGDRRFGQTGLPATLKEVEAIAASLQNSTTLEENNFTRKAIEAQIPKHNILHLATHASFNTGKPDNSFIIFGNGDLLRLSEIPDLQMPNIDLIVLSACQTGVGKLGDGVEILGFGYQVQKAGAKAAIASLWSVSDDGTQALMQVLYEQVKQGEVTISESLRRSQIALIREKKFSHPFYWSAFIAIGNGL